jgi:tetratricopeptide (TPR) repeat protein
LEQAGAQPAENSWAGSALGQALYLSGQAAQARPRLEDLVSQVPASVQPYAVVTALAVLSLLAADQDNPAASLARRAVATAEAHAVNFEPLSGIVYLALGRALARQGELAEAELQLGRALELFRVDSMGLHRTLALLVLAWVRHGRGDLPGARVLADQARELVD